MITEEQNEKVVKIPTKEEIKQVVFSLNADTARGPMVLQDFSFTQPGI